MGGASDGSVGIAVMRYETPTSKALNWRKTWFFLDNDVQFVMLARLTSTNPVPVFSVLDQRKHIGDVFVSGATISDGGNFTAASSLWHGGVGYTFNVSNAAVSLSVQLGTRTGSWQVIGSADEPPETVDIFAAWLNHTDLTVPISYAIYPATSSFSAFQKKAKASQLQTVRNDGSISALLDVNHRIAMIAYWEAAGGSTVIPSPTGNAPLTVKATGNSVVILHLDTWSVTIADPTQTLTNITMTFTLGSGSTPPGWTGTSKTKTLAFALPGGAVIGDSVTLFLS